eukprot:11680819-Ditylum_brightwellii.AAC.2
MSPLSPAETQLFYKSIFQKALGYVFGQSCLESHHLKDIEQKAQRAFATKSGFNCNIKYLIRDGPEELGSANFSLCYMYKERHRSQIS